MKLTKEISTKFGADGYDKVAIWESQKLDPARLDDIISCILDVVEVTDDVQSALYNPIGKSDMMKLMELIVGLGKLNVDGYNFEVFYDFVGWVKEGTVA